MRRPANRRTWRRWLGAGVGVLGLLCAWAGLDFAYVAGETEVDHAATADVIIVLGCPSTDSNGQRSVCVQVRAHHAAELYRRGLARAVIPTGGLTGPGPSEAAALGAVLQADGVPGAAIAIEDRARNTIENIALSGALMCARRWHSAILVTEPHHIRRATLIARDAGLTVVVSPATASPSWHIPAERLHNLTRDASALMLYQVLRVLSFGGEPAKIRCT